MITFPTEFKAIKGFPGYFWNEENCHLYSIKIGGILRPLTKYKPIFLKHIAVDEPYFTVSVNGKHKILTVSTIIRKLIDPYEIPKYV